MRQKHLHLPLFAHGSSVETTPCQEPARSGGTRFQFYFGEARGAIWLSASPECEVHRAEFDRLLPQQWAALAPGLRIVNEALDKRCLSDKNRVP